MEVLHHHPHEHVQNEETHKQNKRNEIEQPPLGVVDYGLLVEPHCVQTVVHDVDPAVPGAQHEQRHEGLPQVVEVVLLVLPFVVVVLAVAAVDDAREVLADAVVEGTFEELDAEDAEDDEECAADEDDVADGAEG